MLEIVAQVAARVEKTAQLQIGHWWVVFAELKFQNLKSNDILTK